MAYHINTTSFTGLNPNNLYTYTVARIVDLTQNTFLKAMSPSLETMTTANSAMSVAEAIFKKNDTPETEAARKKAWDAVLDIHHAWVKQIVAEAGDNLTAILSTGYEVEYDRVDSIAPEGAAPTPKVKPCKEIGAVRLLADPYKQGSAKVYYNWEVSTDNEHFSGILNTGGGSRRTIKGLELDKPYWFRVTYSTTAGAGQPSTSVKIVLTTSLTEYGYQKKRPKGKPKMKANQPAPPPPSNTQSRKSGS